MSMNEQTPGPRVMPVWFTQALKSWHNASGHDPAIEHVGLVALKHVRDRFLAEPVLNLQYELEQTRQQLLSTQHELAVVQEAAARKVPPVQQHLNRIESLEKSAVDARQLELNRILKWHTLLLDTAYDLEERIERVSSELLKRCARLRSQYKTSQFVNSNG